MRSRTRLVHAERAPSEYSPRVSRAGTKRIRPRGCALHAPPSASSSNVDGPSFPPAPVSCARKNTLLAKDLANPAACCTCRPRTDGTRAQEMEPQGINAECKTQCVQLMCWRAQGNLRGGGGQKMTTDLPDWTLALCSHYVERIRHAPPNLSRVG